MDLHDIRNRYLEYMATLGHAVLPAASLLPENDPTTLFTGSGMQPLVPYLLGREHPSGTRLTNSQTCFRSGDIEEVGDNRHTTFFEMLGNWSLGDYGKEAQLPWFFTFLTKELGLSPERLYVTVFSGDETVGVPRDTVAAKVWQDLFQGVGVTANTAVMDTEEAAASRGMLDGERIFYYRDKNWWSRAGAPKAMPPGEPGGPDSEVFYEFTDVMHDTRFGARCHVNCDCGRFLEIGNSVFMQFRRNENGSFEPLPKPNVDFGGGLERLLMAVQNTPDIIRVCHAPIVTHLEQVSGKQYGVQASETRAFRIIADHAKAAVFLIADGAQPGTSDQGYFVRRLIRRAVRYADVLGIAEGGFADAVEPVISLYEHAYPLLRTRAKHIVETVRGEEMKFRATLVKGLREFGKLRGAVSGRDAFLLFSTYGFPIEVTVELAAERGMLVDMNGFTDEMRRHQELSRAGSEQKFKGGLADQSEVTTMLHTCTHLLLAGLRKYLGDHVHQAGSNITAERVRFDFTHPDRVPRETLDRVEAYVNEAIQAMSTVTTTTCTKEAARAAGVEGSFWEKYPEQVTVYEVRSGDVVYSRELCGGPHVAGTEHIVGTFKIIKEESSAAGVRRIKAILVS